MPHEVNFGCIKRDDRNPEFREATLRELPLFSSSSFAEPPFKATVYTSMKNLFGTNLPTKPITAYQRIGRRAFCHDTLRGTAVQHPEDSDYFIPICIYKMPHKVTIKCKKRDCRFSDNQYPIETRCPYSPNTSFGDIYTWTFTNLL